jgi:hypothetical protein
MRPKKYPLEPLARVRRAQLDESARALADAVRAREEAEQKRLAAEREARARAARSEAARETESEALRQGELSVADLQRQGAWEVRVQAEEREAGRVLRDLTAEEATRRSGEASAKAGVTSGEAELKVVLEHRSQWQDAKERADEAVEEEVAAEAWRPRSG